MAPPKRQQEEAIPTTVYEIGQDEELPPTYDPKELSDPGFKPAFLYVEKGPGQGQLVQVKQGSLVIGRASVSELRLQHPSVSRRHAQITRLGERFYLKDLASQNATFVNKVKIETEIEIYPGDQLQIGSAMLKLRGPAEKLPEDAKKQIEKAAAKSAKRTKAYVEPTEPKGKAIPAAGTSKVLLGVACAAIGFGLAAVALFVVLNVTNQKPQFETLGGPIAQLQPPSPSGADDLAITATPIVADTAAKRDPVALRIEREMAQAQRAEDAEITPEPVRVAAAEPASPSRVEPVAERIARKERVQPKRAPAPVKKVAAVSKATARDEDEQELKKPGSGEALKLYEAGEVPEAIAAAKAMGDKDLAAKLTEFQTAYSAGQKAERSNDGAGAVKSYQRALAVDEKISGGWGKHAAAINKRLGNIYVLWGQQLLKDDEDDGANKAFKEALKYDPSNAMAKKYLAGAGAAKPAVADEEDEAPAAKPAAAKKPSKAATRSAIDDAWED